MKRFTISYSLTSISKWQRSSAIIQACAKMTVFISSPCHNDGVYQRGRRDSLCCSSWFPHPPLRPPCPPRPPWWTGRRWWWRGCELESSSRSCLSNLSSDSPYLTRQHQNYCWLLLFVIAGVSVLKLLKLSLWANICDSRLTCITRCLYTAPNCNLYAVCHTWNNKRGVLFWI